MKCRSTLKAYVATVLTVAMASCAMSNDAERYAAIVESWHGRTVVFPQVLTDMLTGDAIQVDDADFTILTYVDSTGCTGCNMRLPLWREYIHSLDSLDNATVQTIMVVNTSNKVDVENVIKRETYVCPIFYDEADSMNMVNGLPEDVAFRTFLLDRSHKVVAIGNPVHNAAIAELYRAIISGRQTYSCSGSASVVVDCNRWEIGEIAVGDSVARDFRLVNNSGDTVYVEKIVSSCDCTEAAAPDGNWLLPRSETAITVRFRADTVRGDFTRMVHVYYEDFDNPTVLELVGSITSKQ